MKIINICWAFSFQINDVEVQYIRTIDNLIATRISFKLQLQNVHFISANPSVYRHNVNSRNATNLLQIQSALAESGGGTVGGLLLRCTATISTLYQEYKEVELGTPQRDPIPARGKLDFGYYSINGVYVPSSKNITNHH